ncbi:hypothetical protein Syun_003915 [Stephania yunnanensis]|uniref:Uncharacterized protein n=1 Tax=Stephania yunnanensis TaxID=152371 RepID=A0AAP0Q0P1_9MAGN
MKRRRRLSHPKPKPSLRFVHQVVTVRVLGVLCSSFDSASFPEVIHERDWYYPSFFGPHTARSRIKLYCEKERLREDQFEQLKMLVDIGDILGACGSIKRTEKEKLKCWTYFIEQVQDGCAINRRIEIELKLAWIGRRLQCSSSSFCIIKRARERLKGMMGRKQERGDGRAGEENGRVRGGRQRGSEATDVHGDAERPRKRPEAA